MLKGNNLILSINGTPLGAARTCSVDRNTDTVEVCSPVDGPARRFIPGTTSWSISAGGLYANAAGADRLRSIWRKYQNGGVVTPLTIQVATDARTVEQGEAILTSLREQGDINSLVKFSINLHGSGPLAEPIYANLKSWPGGDGKIMTMPFDIELDDAYELLTYSYDSEYRSQKIKLYGPCNWFLFDTGESFVRSCIDSYDLSIEHSLYKNGDEASIASVAGDRDTLVVCHRKSDNIVAVVVE